MLTGSTDRRSHDGSSISDRPRVIVEGVALIGIAVGAALAGLSLGAVALAVGVGWLAIALIELRLRARRPHRARTAREKQIHRAALIAYIAAVVVLAIGFAVSAPSAWFWIAWLGLWSVGVGLELIGRRRQRETTRGFGHD